MQDLKPTQMTEPQEQDRGATLPVYMRPQIEMYKEEDLLKRLIVWGCSLQAPGP